MVYSALLVVGAVLLMGVRAFARRGHAPPVPPGGVPPATLVLIKNASFCADYCPKGTVIYDQHCQHAEDGHGERDQHWGAARGSRPPIFLVRMTFSHLSTLTCFFHLAKQTFGGGEGSCQTPRSFRRPCFV